MMVGGLLKVHNHLQKLLLQFLFLDETFFFVNVKKYSVIIE